MFSKSSPPFSEPFIYNLKQKLSRKRDNINGNQWWNRLSEYANLKFWKLCNLKIQFPYLVLANDSELLNMNIYSLLNRNNMDNYLMDSNNLT